MCYTSKEKAVVFEQENKPLIKEGGSHYEKQ